MCHTTWLQNSQGPFTVPLQFKHSCCYIVVPRSLKKGASYWHFFATKVYLKVPSRGHQWWGKGLDSVKHFLYLVFLVYIQFTLVTSIREEKYLIVKCVYFNEWTIAERLLQFFPPSLSCLPLGQAKLSEAAQNKQSIISHLFTTCLYQLHRSMYNAL